MNNWVLCGLPSSGKSTLGKKAAQSLSWQFIDLDEVIEKEFYNESGERLKCREIYRREGEILFRTREKNALKSLQGTNRAVIALGGGALSDPEAIRLIKAIGPLVYLKEDPEILWKRILSGGMPAFLDPGSSKEDFLALAAKRGMVYEKEADLMIDMKNRPPEAVLKEFFYGI